jgi:hypothetical protein
MTRNLISCTTFFFIFLFSHAVDNPDPESEMFLLRKYAPNISEDLLLKLTAAFRDLRKLVDEGLISYPYSTRELVNIVKHMQVNK